MREGNLNILIFKSQCYLYLNYLKIKEDVHFFMDTLP